jgi:hypothetical protein
MVRTILVAFPWFGVTGNHTCCVSMVWDRGDGFVQAPTGTQPIHTPAARRRRTPPLRPGQPMSRVGPSSLFSPWRAGRARERPGAGAAGRAAVASLGPALQSRPRRAPLSCGRLRRRTPCPRPRTGGGVGGNGRLAPEARLPARPPPPAPPPAPPPSGWAQPRPPGRAAASPRAQSESRWGRRPLGTRDSGRAGSRAAPRQVRWGGLGKLRQH